MLFEVWIYHFGAVVPLICFLCFVETFVLIFPFYVDWFLFRLSFWLLTLEVFILSFFVCALLNFIYIFPNKFCLFWLHLIRLAICSCYRWYIFAFMVEPYTKSRNYTLRRYRSLVTFLSFSFHSVKCISFFYF